ncbi:class E sortase [Microbacterium sp. LMI1-1-1.1]|uniref:class E sortase n=1 Tax=Microbacterium sp. LMI1-1-1.1 TaxID=3135223 RepID=UPI0034654E39
MHTVPPAENRRTRRRAPRRRRVSVIGVFGELLMTAGVLVFLFVAWQLWIGDEIYSAQRTAEAAEQSEEWQAEFEASQPSLPAAEPTPDAPQEIEPPDMPKPADAEVFANMHIPRFGVDYVYKIAGGVTRANTLDPIGIGHYNDTVMPGQVGNFALAAHRTTYGKPFNRIADLHVNDAIVVETPAGWYTYRFRTLEYVTPDEVDVLRDVPQHPDLPADGRYITMTSCSPMFSLAERIVAYGVFESYTPREAGPPAALTEGVA